MKRFLAILLSTLLICTLTACGGSSAPESNPSSTSQSSTSQAQTGEKRVLKVSNNGGLQMQEERQFMQEEIIAPFEEEFNCVVEMDALSGSDGIKTIETQFGSNNVITDVVIVHSGEMPRYIRNGWVQPITDLYNGFTDRTFVDSFESSTHADGEAYFAPMSSDVYLTLVNKDALSYLPEGADVEKLTWDQYAEFAINIAKGEGVGKTVMPCLPGKNLIYEVGAMGLSYGAAFPDMTSDSMIKVWDLLAKMAQEDAFLSTQHTAGDATAFMQRKEALLTVGHMGQVGLVYQGAPEQFILASAPSGDAGTGSVGGAWGVGVVTGTKNQDLAEQFVDYLTRPEVMYEMCAGLGGRIPTTKEVLELLGSDPTDVIIQKGLEVLNNGIIHGVPSAQFSDFAAVKTQYETVYQNIVQNKTYTMDELKAAEDAINALRL